MQKAEIRIGNFLKPKISAEKFAVVQGITENGIKFYNGNTCSFAEIEPLKITTEILANSGFVYGRKYDSNEFYDIKKAFDLSGNEVWEFKRNNERLKYLLYVHQMQNLFFEISGEELELVV